MSPEDQTPICQFITVVVGKTFGKDNLTKSDAWLEETHQLQRNRMDYILKNIEIGRNSEPC